MESVIVLCCVLVFCAVAACVIHDVIATGIEMWQKALMPRMYKVAGLRQFYFFRRHHDRD